MSQRTLMVLMSLVAAAAVYAVGRLLIPFAALLPAVHTALIVLSLGAGVIFLSPVLTGPRQTNAPLFAMLGPVATLAVSILLLGAIALIAGLAGKESIAWAACVLAVGAGVIGTLMTVSAARVIDNVAAQDAAGRERQQWQEQLAVLAVRAPEALKERTVALGEAVRFTASDVAGVNLPENAAISQSLANLDQAFTRGELAEATSLIDSITALLAVRDSKLRSQRSKI